jgi:hypothetical protein
MYVPTVADRAVNHRTFLDGPLLFGIVRRPVNFLVEVEAFPPGMTPFLRGTGHRRSHPTPNGEPGTYRPTRLVNRRRVLAATEQIRSAPADLVATTILSEPRRLAA